MNILYWDDYLNHFTSHNIDNINYRILKLTRNLSNKKKF